MSKKNISIFKIAVFAITTIVGAASFRIQSITSNAAMQIKTINSTKESPWQYGEMENGFFVRTLAEELEWLEPTDVRYDNEYNKAIEARKLEVLTPEMETAGYILVDGIAYPPEEAEGDASAEAVAREEQKRELESATTVTEFDENGNPIVKYGWGYVQFASIVQPEIHETCFIEVTNYTSKKSYLFNLYEMNSYNKSVQLPEGKYYISDGGIANDFKDEYPIAGNDFEVKTGEATIVTFSIGNVNIEEAQNGITVVLNDVSANSDTITEDDSMSSDESKLQMGSFSIRDIVSIICVVVVLGLIVLFCYKKFYS